MIRLTTSSGKALISTSILAAALVGSGTWWAASVYSQPARRNSQTAVLSWDLGLNDQQAFLSLLADGRVIMDAMALPAPLDAVLRNGHGEWRVQHQDGTLFIRTIHMDDAPGQGVWEIDTRAMPSSNGHFAGVSAIRHFASLQDLLGNQQPLAGLKVDSELELVPTF